MSLSHPFLVAVLLLASGGAIAQAQSTTPPPESDPKPARMQTGSCKKPDYPKESARLGEVGTTKIRFFVGADGSVTKTEITRSSGSARLDDAAVTSLSQCKFAPAIVDGKPVAGTTMVDYVWKLEDEVPMPFWIGPNLATCPIPIEPPGSAQRTSTVTTKARIEFQRYGRPTKVEIDSSSGHQTLDQAVIWAFQRCIFGPQSIAGAPFVSSAIVEYSWRPNAARPTQ